MLLIINTIFCLPLKLVFQLREKSILDFLVYIGFSFRDHAQYMFLNKFEHEHVVGIVLQIKGIMY